MKRILVVGDAIADVYTSCAFKKMCPDAPSAPALVEGRSELMPGGAANVALNVAALDPDAVVDLFSIMGTDLYNAVRSRSGGRVNVHGWLSPSLVKRRFSIDGRVIVRVDSFSKFQDDDLKNLRGELESYLCSTEPDIIILSDYGSGVSSASLDVLMRFKDRLIIDTKETDLSAFEGSLMCKLNRPEWREVILRDHSPESHFGSLVVTDGEHGAEVMIHRLLSSGRTATHSIFIKGIKTDAIDVCGCGDTFIAGLAVAMASHGDPFTAAQFANAAASTVVSQRGTAVADREKTLKILGREKDEACR